ncbi:LOW QUALITY PROTEIN: ABC transporter [Phytophthora megakarya]|uniref:ABC transporter n=1 Tax=Phytophthora megakarya TaxID=4795 RepID=A0A225WRL7_9STRA|nr:LOW QUALITY PROTEIN: ABC transporter [Phytophthora megakarya]
MFGQVPWRLSKNDEKYFANGSDQENNAALDTARAMCQHYLEIVISWVLTINTVVGDAMIRGESGDERKRTTSGEIANGTKPVLISSIVFTYLPATFDIIATQKTFRKTIVISLLQPSPEVYSLFDSVIILNEGQFMYNGARPEGLEYFQSLGFKCPAHRLLDLRTNKQLQYEVGKPSHNVPHSVSEFVNAFGLLSSKRFSTKVPPTDSTLIENKKGFIDSLPEFHQNFWGSSINDCLPSSMEVGRARQSIRYRTIRGGNSDETAVLDNFLARSLRPHKLQWIAYMHSINHPKGVKSTRSSTAFAKNRQCTRSSSVFTRK